jgi:Putative transposase/Transposase zinc-binding domain
MSAPKLELADILRRHGQSFLENQSASAAQRRAVRAILQCRSAELGGHVDQCDSCGHKRISYNSCRNRHCPKCRSLEKARWLDQRQSELLPVHYFHVVFTIPRQLSDLVLQNKKVAYNILFRSTAETLLRIAADPKHLGAKIGFLAILHTWGQNVLHHPHIHCVIPGGGISLDNSRWVACRQRFFLPVRVLSRLFQGLFLHYLDQAFKRGQLEFHGSLAHLSDSAEFTRLLSSCRRLKWVVYAKRPFGSPAQVLGYLGRYTHRVAISNHRLLGLEDGKVSFTWKDYRNGNAQQVMHLDAQEFIRRFLLHILPSGLVRIRYYGFLSNSHRREKLAICRDLIGTAKPQEPLSPQTPTLQLLSTPQDWKTKYEQLTGHSLSLCPLCRTGRMLTVELLQPTTSPRLPESQPEVVNSS